MSDMRVFFAIPLPASAKPALADIMATLKKSIPSDTIRWSMLDNLHVTLQFLNPVQRINLPALIAGAHRALENSKPFELEYGKLELFPAISSPKFISLDMSSVASLTELANTIAVLTSKLGYPLDTRPFRGHITLGRLGHTHVNQSMLEQLVTPAIPPSFITDICLYESKPTHQGSHYLPLATFALKCDE